MWCRAWAKTLAAGLLPKRWAAVARRSRRRSAVPVSAHSAIIWLVDTVCVCMRVRACVNVSVCEEARGQGNNGRVQSSGTATRTKRNCCVVRSNGNSWHSWPCSTASTERVYVSNGTTASSCDNADRNSLLQKKQREEENNKKNNKRKGFADRLEGGERGVSSACLTTRQSGTPSGCRVSSTSSGRCSAANGTRSLISSSKRRLSERLTD